MSVEIIAKNIDNEEVGTLLTKTIYETSEKDRKLNDR